MRAAAPAAPAAKTAHLRWEAGGSEEDNENRMFLSVPVEKNVY
jgi:hypothetical protein